MLVFAHCCSGEKLIYKRADGGLDIFQGYNFNGDTISMIELNFHKKHTKIKTDAILTPVLKLTQLIN
ncbi:MAG: hypothetical protein R2814_09870 [Flavobacteriaceae bacterium]